MKEISKLLQLNDELEARFNEVVKQNDKLSKNLSNLSQNYQKEIYRLQQRNDDLELILSRKPETRSEVIKYNIEEVSKILGEVKNKWDSSKNYEDEIEELRIKVKELQKINENQKNEILLDADLKIKELEETKESALILVKMESTNKIQSVKKDYENQLKHLETETHLLKDKIKRYELIEEKLSQKEVRLREKSSTIEDLKEIKSSLTQQILSKDEEIKEMFKTIRKYQKTLEKSSLLNLKSDSLEK